MGMVSGRQEIHPDAAITAEAHRQPKTTEPGVSSGSGGLDPCVHLDVRSETWRTSYSVVPLLFSLFHSQNFIAFREKKSILEVQPVSTDCTLKGQRKTERVCEYEEVCVSVCVFVWYWVNECQQGERTTRGNGRRSWRRLGRRRVAAQEGEWEEDAETPETTDRVQNKELKEGAAHRNRLECSDAIT